MGVAGVVGVVAGVRPVGVGKLGRVAGWGDAGVSGCGDEAGARVVPGGGT